MVTGDKPVASGSDLGRKPGHEARFNRLNAAKLPVLRIGSAFQMLILFNVIHGYAAAAA